MNIFLRADAFVLLRFGNYIGEAGESEEESLHGEVGAETYTYDIESEGEEGRSITNGQQLMRTDGDLRASFPHIVSNFGLTLKVDQTRVHQMRSFYMKINSTTLPLNRFMVQMWRLWWKRKMRSH